MGGFGEVVCNDIWRAFRVYIEERENVTHITQFWLASRVGVGNNGSTSTDKEQKNGRIRN